MAYMVTADHLPEAEIVGGALEAEAATQMDLFAPVSALTGSL